MMEDKIYITLIGKKKITEEIRHLKFEVRPKIVKEVEEARAQGDLSENAEYHAARERLAMIDAKTNNLEFKLLTKVKLINLDSMKEISYRIVGDFETDPQNNEISINSPIARALIGKIVGDEVTVRTPGGQKTFEIVEINV